MGKSRVTVCATDKKRAKYQSLDSQCTGFDAKFYRQGSEAGSLALRTMTELPFRVRFGLWGDQSGRCVDFFETKVWADGPPSSRTPVEALIVSENQGCPENASYARNHAPDMDSHAGFHTRWQKSILLWKCSFPWRRCDFPDFPDSFSFPWHFPVFLSVRTMVECWFTARTLSNLGSRAWVTELKWMWKSTQHFRWQLGGGMARQVSTSHRGIPTKPSQT